MARIVEADILDRIERRKKKAEGGREREREKERERERERERESERARNQFTKLVFFVHQKIQDFRI